MKRLSITPLYLYTDYNKHKESSEHVMSNLGEWIEEKAIEKTIEKTTKELILNMHKYGLSLEKIADIDLPYHVAHKKTDYMNENGEFIEATEPNAYKFEAFIFDAFNYFDNITILRGRREDDFAPIKNKNGVDSPETAIKLYNDYWKSKR